ncbi:MAG: hypothetical protein KatS3mg078_1983 [Deltaproteobacteria bacterium]|nr:MAG: hypothetical protein KatS3mg078_1983 [Deltaproteobacteria bacterium]
MYYIYNPNHTNPYKEAMGKPSRYKEIHRRRVRREKLRLLRKRYLNATSDEERQRIFEKVKRVSPGLSLEEFLLQKAPAH